MWAVTLPLGGGRRVRSRAQVASEVGPRKAFCGERSVSFTLGDNFAQRPGCQMFAAVLSLLSSAFYKIEKLNKEVPESLSSL